MGTTTACYFSSLYGESSLILAKKAAKHGQRALVGKVNMNNSSTGDYWETTENSIKNTKEFISGVQNIDVTIKSIHFFIIKTTRILICYCKRMFFIIDRVLWCNQL